MDLGGLTTFHSVASYLYRELSRVEEPQAALASKVAAGETGVQAGRGDYGSPAESAQAAIAARDSKVFELLEVSKRWAGQ